MIIRRVKVVVVILATICIVGSKFVGRRGGVSRRVSRRLRRNWGIGV